MKISFFIFCIIFLFSSCKDDLITPQHITWSRLKSKGPYHELELKFVAKQFLPLRSGEYYSLWVRERPTLVWTRVSDSNLFSYQYRDSNIFFFRFADSTIDSLADLLLTIEKIKNPASPGITVLQSLITHTHDTAYAYFTAPVLPDADKISGAVTFTSRSLDTTAYTREFYLLKLFGSLAEQSLQNLPSPPQGFRYGVWAYDTDFFPPQQFLYGTFTSATGNDDDTTGDEYAFPGGAKKAPLNTTGGLIIVTLEPTLWGSDLKTKGPSPYRLLEFVRTKNIIRDSAYQMNNIAYSLPTGYARFIVWK